MEFICLPLCLIGIVKRISEDQNDRKTEEKTRVLAKHWFMLSLCISSYGCTWEVWRARKKRKSNSCFFFSKLEKGTKEKVCISNFVCENVVHV